MSKKSSIRVLFLSWESPWPAHSGAALRTLGLLREISKVFDVELIVMTRQPLFSDQTVFLGGMASSVIRIPLRDVSVRDKLVTVSRMLSGHFPYHNSVLGVSLQNYPELRRRILQFPGIVFTSNGNWGTLVRDRHISNWILNQCDADVEFWRVYASQNPSRFVKWVALVNYQLAKRHFPQIYANVGRIIAVCEEDRQLTLSLALHAQVDVIENGVDCSYYTPQRMAHTGLPRLLFTGTSAARNVTALRRFVRNILPLIQHEIPDIELLIAGNFSQKAQTEFTDIDAMRFTGRVDDMRLHFNQSDVYVAPFEETHGSKLKIAEAMAMAMPIVSTPQGIRGFSLVDGESVLIARSDEDFADQVISLIRDPLLRKRLGDNTRQVALATIDWSVLGQKLIHIIQETATSLGIA